LYVWPKPAPITPVKEGDEIATSWREHRLLAAFKRLVELDLPKEGPPRKLRLSSEALHLYQQPRRAEMEMARSARGIAAGWHGKNPGRLLRLALAFELLRWAAGSKQAEPRQVAADAGARAGRNLDYLALMFERLTAKLAITDAEANAALIAREIIRTRADIFAQAAKQHGGKFILNERDLYRRPTWRWARDKIVLADALEVLREAGWIRATPLSAKGGRPLATGSSMRPSSVECVSLARGPNEPIGPKPSKCRFCRG
jgi:hypothetical protein